MTGIDKPKFKGMKQRAHKYEIWIISIEKAPYGEFCTPKYNLSDIFDGFYLTVDFGLWKNFENSTSALTYM